MADPDTSQTQKRPSTEAGSAEDMAAQLFTELFYKPVMAESEQKQKHAHDERFDSRPKEGLK